MSKRAYIGWAFVLVFCFAGSFASASGADTFKRTDEGVPVGIGAVTSSGGLVPASTTTVNVLMKMSEDRFELLPVSMSFNDSDLSASAIALINGAIRMEKVLKIYYEGFPDGEKRVSAIEAAGVTIKFP